MKERAWNKSIEKMLPEKEKKARKAACKYFKDNCCMGDWDSECEKSYREDPLQLWMSCDAIADALTDYFGEDVPAEIIDNLRAC